MDRRARLASARLYLVCDRRPRGLLEAALRGGVDIVQLRDKDATDDELLAAAADVRAVCADAGALFILNDRPDLVTAAGADGVHVGQGDASVAEARALVGPDRLVGLSVDAVGQLADAGGADYLGVGPVAGTPTKPEGVPVGLELVARVAARAAVPCFAIGGIDLASAPDVARAGVTGVAVVRAIIDAADPEGAARELRAALEVGVGAT
jgi:thiamine-phosphate pyrophosphorylase